MSSDSEPSLPNRLDAGPFDLRRATSAYVDRVIEAVAESIDELRPWMAWAQTIPTAAAINTVLSEADLKFRANTDWMYLLVDPETSVVLGGSGLHRRIGPHGIEIGYWVRSSVTGRGYATQTSKTLTEAAFRYLDWVDRVEIHMDKANLASAAVPRKLGFTLVREEDRPKVTSGHSGREYVWSMERVNWNARSEDQ